MSTPTHCILLGCGVRPRHGAVLCAKHRRTPYRRDAQYLTWSFTQEGVNWLLDTPDEELTGEHPRGHLVQLAVMGSLRREQTLRVLLRPQLALWWLAGGFSVRWLDEEGWLTLASSPSARVRGRMAHQHRRRRLPDAVCLVLASDTDVIVRRELAASGDLPQEVYDLLSQDDDAVVLRHVLQSASALRGHGAPINAHHLGPEAASSLREYVDGVASRGEVLEAVEFSCISESTREVALGLARDGWEGTLAELLQTAQLLSSSHP